MTNEPDSAEDRARPIDSDPRWRTTIIAGHPVEVFTPGMTSETAPRETVLFLHGYDGVTLRQQPRYTAALERERLQCVCPIGPQCWWTAALDPQFSTSQSPLDWLCEALVPALLLRTPALALTGGSTAPVEQSSTPTLAVLGVEMGGQGALQLAYRLPRHVPIVVAIGPKIDFETWWGHGLSLDDIFPDRETARQYTATLQIHPLNWPKHQFLWCDPQDHYCLDGVLTLASKLNSSGIPFELDVTTSHGGFGWSYANFVADRAMTTIAALLRGAR